jgi:hypothetical protein
MVGRFSIHGGALRGLALMASRNTLEFVDSSIDSRITETQTVSWNRASLDFKHRYVLTHRQNDYGTNSFQSEDLILTGQENGNLGRRWTWDGSLVGRERSTSTGSDARSYRTARLFNRFVKRYDQRGSTLRISQSYAGNQPNATTTTHGLGLSVGYQTPISRAFTVAAGGGYSTELGGKSRNSKEHPLVVYGVGVVRKREPYRRIGLDRGKFIWCRGLRLVSCRRPFKNRDVFVGGLVSKRLSTHRGYRPRPTGSRVGDLTRKHFRQNLCQVYPRTSEICVRCSLGFELEFLRFSG